MEAQGRTIFEVSREIKFYGIAKGTSMNRKMVSTILSTLGVLFILASSFDILQSNSGIFLGMACFIIAGVVWSLKFDN